jgi:hypothetical protein
VTLPLAHETWFESGHRSLDWGFAGETLTLVLLAGALLVTVAVRLLARVFPGVDIPFLVAGHSSHWVSCAELVNGGGVAWGGVSWSRQPARAESLGHRRDP